MPLPSSCETETERYDGQDSTPENSARFVNINDINIEVRNPDETHQEGIVRIRNSSTRSEPRNSILENPLRNGIIESLDSIDIPITDRVII